MLDKIDLAGIPCFEGGSKDIGPLTPVSFIFGPNGSGKTSISRRLASISDISSPPASWDGTPMDVRVYNRDFAGRVIEQYSHLKGVFLIGEENVDIRRQLEKLIGPDGKKEKAKALCDRAESNLHKHEDEFSKARAALTDEAWKKRGSVPDEIRPMFDGYNGSREKFANRLIVVAEDSANEQSQIAKETLLSRARTIFDASSSEEDQIKQVPSLDASKMVGYALLSTSVVGSQTSTLSELIEKLGNSDWVLHGRPYLEQSHSLCPFCQQETPESLAKQLEDLFDRTYESQRADLAVFSEAYSSQTSSLLGSAKTLLKTSSAVVDDKQLKLAITELEKSISENLSTIRQKIETPSSIVDLQDLSTSIDSINSQVCEANKVIAERNRQIKQRAKERPALVSDCWKYFVSQVVRDEVTLFLAEKKRLTPAINGIKRTLEGAEDQLSDAEQQEHDLNAQLVSSQPTIERMNSMLRGTGFTSFKLAPSQDLPDGYTIVRENGVIKARSLSEGECTFLSVLYFFYLLQDRGIDATARDILAVIDDPITSMDSDVMVVVSTLIRSLVAQAIEGTGRVSQVLVLTHNVYFHREVTYRFSNKTADPRRSYFVIRKGDGCGNNIQRFVENPIKSIYGRLWDEVRAAGTETGYQSPVGLENVMRRILETYFSILGNVGQKDVIDKFKGQEQLVCRSLYMWANGGSHSIFDDSDYSPSLQSVVTYLKVFRQIFVATGQLPHYEMMMSEGSFVKPAD
ncbi:MAG: AAA family ATPase [Pseudoclavibacter sp.]